MTPQALLDAGMDLLKLQQLLYRETDGYSLAEQGKNRTQNTGHENFVYGEVSPQAMWEMLHTIEAKPQEVFYDLGSGTGKGVLYAAILFEFAKCKGIEYLEELHAAAEASVPRYHEHVLPLLTGKKNHPEISFTCADLRTQDISDADIVFAHCTTWNDELMDGARQKLETLKSGSRVITISRGVESPELHYMGYIPVRMAWGNASAYFYQRV